MSTLNPLWQDTEFDSIFYVEKGVKKKQIQTKDYLPLGKFPIVDQGKEQIVAYSNDVEKLYASTPVIVFGDHTRILKYITFPFVVGADGTQLLKVKNNFSLRFCFYLLQNTKIENLGYSRHMSLLKEKVFTLPPLPEQEKIAEILGCWDTAIEKLTALIEQKKLLKKGLMQRLLTGKQRLPGFSTPWNKVKLKNICDISKGEQLGRLEMTETGVYPVINGGISKSGLTDSYNREKDTITISEGGNSCGFVAFMKERFWCGGHCYALSNLQTNLHFLFQILKSKESDIMKLRVGSGLPNIQKSSLDAFSLHIPTDISEQKAIADILSKADEEIDLLTRKLSALKSQKKGLMQKLLTGQIRVKGA